MTLARKFAFDTEFAPDGTIMREAPAARRFTAAEMEAEKLAAYDRGQTDAVAAAEKASAQALRDLASRADALLQRLDAESAALRSDALEIALVAARAIAGAALAEFGEARARAAIEETMDSLRHGPRLIIRLPAEQAEKFTPGIEALGAEMQYQGALIVRADANLKAGAVEIDWGDGAVVIDPDEIAARVAAFAAAALAGAENGEAT